MFVYIYVLFYVFVRIGFVHLLMTEFDCPEVTLCI